MKDIEILLEDKNSILREKLAEQLNNSDELMLEETTYDEYFDTLSYDDLDYLVENLDNPEERRFITTLKVLRECDEAEKLGKENSKNLKKL